MVTLGLVWEGPRAAWTCGATWTLPMGCVREACTRAAVFWDSSWMLASASCGECSADRTEHLGTGSVLRQWDVNALSELPPDGRVQRPGDVCGTENQGPSLLFPSPCLWTRALLGSSSGLALVSFQDPMMEGLCCLASSRVLPELLSQPHHSDIRSEEDTEEGAVVGLWPLALLR